MKHRGYTVLRNLAWALLAAVAWIPLAHELAPDGLRLTLVNLIFVLPLVAVVLAIVWPCKCDGPIAAWRKWLVGLAAPFSLLLLIASVAFVVNDSGLFGIFLTARFRRTVQDADRIVIRDGGYDCCRTNIDDQVVLCTITNKDEIAAFNEMFRFSRLSSPCMCCGYPGIDWWQGDRKIARAALHHGQALRWKGFAVAARLAVTSRQNLLEWFDKRLNADVRYVTPGWREEVQQ